MSAANPAGLGNQRYLMAAVAVVRAHLRRHLARSADEEMQAAAELAASTAAETAAQQELDAPAPLELLCAQCALSDFERGILLLCVGVELDPQLAQLCRLATGAASFGPSFSLALAVLPTPHWSALLPVSALRQHMLIELIGEESLLQQSLRLPERVLHYLVGLNYLEPRLKTLLRPVPEPPPLPPSQQSLVLRVIHYLHLRALKSPPALAEEHAPPARAQVQLAGTDLVAATSVATIASVAVGLRLCMLQAIDLPRALVEREQLLALWQREAMLAPRALLIHCSEVLQGEQIELVSAFCERFAGPLFIVAPEPLPLRQEDHLRIEVLRPTYAEQCQMWQEALQTQEPLAGHDIANLATHFDLGAATISAAATSAVARHAAEPEETFAKTVWLECRSRARKHLEGLARCIVPQATWDDLVLPSPVSSTLRQIVAQVRQRQRVYEDWGLGGRQRRGLGISVLFAGASGTGKTLAAEVIACALQLELYQIDLSQLVSKYIGETEKNLRKIFDAADAGGAVLLFDEADALFGKRSEVKDSHDRYANIEVSYLLQRIEQYRGLAILTTNMKSALDDAFLRRLRFVVQFPFPDSGQRSEIWQREFPATVPQETLDLRRLGRLPLPGGTIRNIALNAAFLAADQGLPVRMAHLIDAARSEYDKLEKPFDATELGGGP
jgi:hypothetical protein